MSGPQETVGASRGWSLGKHSQGGGLECWGSGSPQPIPQPTPKFPRHSCPLTFLGIENAGLAQLAEEGAPAAGGLQVVQMEVGWVQPTGQMGEACKREKTPLRPLCLPPGDSFHPLCCSWLSGPTLWCWKP